MAMVCSDWSLASGGQQATPASYLDDLTGFDSLQDAANVLLQLANGHLFHALHFA